jgi:uncharacterized membrane protein YeiB
VAFERVQTESLPTAVMLGVGFFAVAVMLSWAWKMRFRHGPMESVMRKLAG